MRASTSTMMLSLSKVITSIVQNLRALLELREAAAMFITYVIIVDVLKGFYCAPGRVLFTSQKLGELRK